MIIFSLTNLIILISPITAHLSEELWQKMGFKSQISEEDFPKFNKNLTVDDEISMPVQVLGKLRAVINVAKDLDSKELEKLALQNDNVQKFILGKEIKKVIIVTNKMINILI